MGVWTNLPQLPHRLVEIRVNWAHGLDGGPLLSPLPIYNLIRPLFSRHSSYTVPQSLLRFLLLLLRLPATRLWVDKYRPRALDKIIAHEEIAQNLKKLVSEHDCPHLLVYGPTGSGKKTLVMALLKQMFGPGAEKVKLENKMWKIDAGTQMIELVLTMLSSTHHVEMNPSDAGFQDRYIVQEIIKEMARNRPVDTKGKKGFKVLVLNEVDKLSREGQHSLRRTMEKYSASCRLILCCNSSSKVTEAVRSRCLNIRVNAPTEEQIIKVLEFIGKKENPQLPPGFTARIAAQSNRNLRRAILSFETCRVQQYPFTINLALPPLDWEQYVSEIASDIVKEQSPKRLFSVRGKIYELLVNCIPPEIILKKLLSELLKKLDSELKHEVCHWAAYFVRWPWVGVVPVRAIESHDDNWWSE
nr:PREDICTED: replication factor C subunit 5-like [Musa acuminata subsp. malaccensis]